MHMKSAMTQRFDLTFGIYIQVDPVVTAFGRPYLGQKYIQNLRWRKS